jgi:hypothetical protein
MEQTLRVEEKHFEDYTREMRYVSNFSELTLTNCRQIFKRWQRFIGGMPTEDNLTEFIIKMREADLSPVTCNITIRTFNSFLTWLHKKGAIGELRMKELPEEKKVKKTFCDNSIKKIGSIAKSGSKTLLSPLPVL